MGRTIERRADVRFRHEWFASLRTILRPGCLVGLVNLSAGGARVTSPRPLRPGARVHVQFIADVRSLALVAHVVRCSVSAIDPDDGVVYEAALRFDHRCDLFREAARATCLGLPEPDVLQAMDFRPV